MKIKKTRARILAFLSGFIISNIAQSTDGSSASLPQEPVTDVYHQVTVADPYRWLENGADPKVSAWSAAENLRARKYLDSLPLRAPIFKQLFGQYSATSSSYAGLRAVGNSVFAYYSQPPKQQPMIAVLTNGADPALARVIVDPNVINTQGTTAIDWFEPSPDGKMLAVSMSENGSEDGTLHLFAVDSGKQIGPLIPRVQYPTGGGGLAWRADNKGFWYTRYPGNDRPAAERHFFQQIYFHRLGNDPAKDSYVLGKNFPKVAEIKFESRFNPQLVIASVANGDGGEFAHYVIDGGSAAQQITRFEDKVVAVAAGADGSLYLVSRLGAPRGKVLKLPPGVRDLSRAATLVPEGDGVMLASGEFGGEPIVVTSNALYLRELVGGPSRVAIYDHTGKPEGVLPLPDVSAVNEVEPLSDGTLLYSVGTYLRPPYFRRYDPKSTQATDTALAQLSPVKFLDTEVVREYVKSKDGTSIPINIVRRKGTQLNGANPVLLYGYGGFGISETPGFLGPDIRLWLDGGGVYVDANLRGGGEYGEDWHQQGALTHKQNVFDDFLAVAEHLIAEKYTDTAHLAILGGSNGGLLMGAAVTQRPDLFRAVVSLVGIYDMLRVELDPNGSFNTTEYGSVRDPEQFKALYAYSPYHNVKATTAYPAIFMATGETDGRVNPAHSRKMIARLRAATSSGKPIFLSINAHAGHGIGSALSIRVNQQADIYAFLFDQLDMQLPQNAAAAKVSTAR
jgi:prolyl oligopeptidase